MVFLIFLSVFTAAYSPAIFQDYAHHDSYRFFQYPHLKSYIHPFHAVNLAIGRFVGAGLQTLVSRHIYFLWQLKYLRGFNLACLALCAFLFFSFLNNFYPNRFVGFATTLILFSLPPFSLMVFWAASFWKIAASVFALVAADFVLKVPADRPFYRNLADRHALLAGMILFTGYATYQPAASFYWVMMMIVFLFGDRKNEGRSLFLRLSNFISIGVITLIVYFLYLRWVKTLFYGAPMGTYSPFCLESHFWEKMMWFFNEPMENVLNLWNIFPDPRITAIAGIVLCGVVINKVTRNPGERRISRVLLNFLGVVVITVFSFLPCILGTGQFAFYRCLQPLSSILILLVLWSLSFRSTNGRKGALRAGAILLAVAFLGLVLARHIMVKYRVRPSQEEYRFLQQKFLNEDVISAERIWIIRPDIDRIWHRYDEFAIPTTYYPESIPGMLRSMTLSLNKAQQAIYQRQIARVNLRTLESPTASLSVPKGTIVIDMNQLYQPGGPLAYLAKE